MTRVNGNIPVLSGMGTIVPVTRNYQCLVDRLQEDTGQWVRLGSFARRHTELHRIEKLEANK